MDTNVKFEEEKQKVIKILNHIYKIPEMEIKSKYPELWEALLDAEVVTDV